MPSCFMKVRQFPYLLSRETDFEGENNKNYNLESS